MLGCKGFKVIWENHFGVNIVISWGGGSKISTHPILPEAFPFFPEG